MNKLLVITGPTATGKTKLGIELAKKFNGEILSADSRQIYKGMDIGTGKDKDLYQKEGVKVWGIDLVEPDSNFSVFDWVEHAAGVIRDIRERGKLPIVVGGTGQYIKELLNPSETLHIPPDFRLRKKLEKLLLPKLQEKLQKVNPKRWAQMSESDQKNPRRLVRAIEVAGKIDSGPIKILADFQGKPDQNDDRDILIIGLTAPYKYLYQRIDKRVEERIKNGVEEEKERLLKKYKKLPKSLGYSNETARRWKFAEHAYARRQMTYLRKWIPGIVWFNVSKWYSGNNGEEKAE